MNTETLIALRASITHWEENLAAAIDGRMDDVSTRQTDCALCMSYLGDNCRGCPVRSRMGEKYCRHTPYHTAHNALLDYQENEVSRDDVIAAIRSELYFLRSLLPEGVK